MAVVATVSYTSNIPRKDVGNRLEDPMLLPILTTSQLSEQGSPWILQDMARFIVVVIPPLGSSAPEGGARVDAACLRGRTVDTPEGVPMWSLVEWLLGFVSAFGFLQCINDTKGPRAISLKTLGPKVSSIQ